MYSIIDYIKNYFSYSSSHSTFRSIDLDTLCNFDSIRSGFSYVDACNWINSIDKLISNEFLGYFGIHKIRYMNTYQMLKFIPKTYVVNKVLDLGGFVLFTGLCAQMFGSRDLFITNFRSSDVEKKQTYISKLINLPLSIHH